MNKPKTLLVGLDAACWEYLNPLLQTQQLPTLQRLVETGIHGILQSTLPALTPVAWASIITGKNPGKHGVFDMLRRQPGTYDLFPVNAKTRSGTPFWQRLNDTGVRVGLVNIPFTYPPEPLEGFVVCGFGTPDSVSDIAYPGEIIDWVNTCYGGYRPTVDTKLNNPADIFQAEKSLQSTQVQIAIDLAAQYQVDVLAINLMFLDHANHQMPDMEQVHNAIRETDTHLHKLITGFQPNNIMLISDHGSRRVEGDFLLHSWLEDNGYCQQLQRTKSEKSQALNRVLRQWLINRGLKLGLLEKPFIHSLNGAMLNLPQKVASPIWNALAKEFPILHRYVSSNSQIDYSQSQLFPGALRSDLFYFNLIGREPEGVVSDSQKIDLWQELAQKLTQLTDPEKGQKIFTNVYLSQELYEGPAAPNGPDIILDSYDSPYGVEATYYHPSLTEEWRGQYIIKNQNAFGWHSRDGIFVFSGTDFRQGFISDKNHVMDVPSTLLNIYDVPIPEDYDGQVLVETFRPDFMAHHPIRYQPGDLITTQLYDDNFYSSEETEELMSQLRALGYID